MAGQPPAPQSSPAADRSLLLNDSPTGHPARAALRVRLEPRVLLQAPRGVRGLRRRHQAPLPHGEVAVVVEVVRAGMIIGGGAWILHVAAISLAPLSVVQAVLAGGVAMLAVMAEKLFGLDVGPRQWWGLALTAIGLILLGVTLPRQRRRPLELLDARDDRLRGRPVRRRRAAHHGPAPRRPGRAPRHHARRRLRHPLRRLQHRRQGADRHDRRRGPPRPPLAVDARRDRRLDHRLLRVGPLAAGRRGRLGHRDHRHRREHLVHRRRDHRLRRPDARHDRSASSSSRSAFLLVIVASRAHARAGPRGQGAAARARAA